MQNPHLNEVLTRGKGDLEVVKVKKGQIHDDGRRF